MKIRSDLKFSLLAIAIAFFAACAGTSAKKDNPITGKEVTYTTIDLAFNVSTNEYPRLTAEKTVYDTVMLVVTDSSGGKMVSEKRGVRDSSYRVWYPMPVPDSTGKNALRNKANTADSFQFRFMPIDNKIVIHDFNKNWPVIK